MDMYVIAHVILNNLLMQLHCLCSVRAKSDATVPVTGTNLTTFSYHVISAGQREHDKTVE